MGLKQMIPAPSAVVREGLIVFGGLLIAAAILSQFPGLKKFVQENT